MRNCGLLGKNILYSKSPDIHNSYYEEKGIPLKYTIFDVKDEELADFVENLRKNNIAGFNVTIPYKEKIIEYLDEIRYPADKIKAVNTVLVDKDKLIGFNTDYDGFIISLKNSGVDPKGCNTLIIGGGGSAKCVYQALMDLEASNIDIITRNIKKVGGKFGEKTNILELGEEQDFSIYDLIVNCTPLGGPNYKELVPIEIKKLKADSVVYDLNYVPKMSRLLCKSEALGAKVINGYDMLLNQAYRAIEIWRKVTEE